MNEYSQDLLDTIGRRGACVDTGIEFFIENSDKKMPDRYTPSPYQSAKTTAKAVCAECLVQTQCREFAQLEHMEEGIWGGLTYSERQQQKYPRQKINGHWVYQRQTA